MTTAEKIQAKKIAFFTEKLQLTSVEAQRFWPVYNEYVNKKTTINQQRNNLIKYYIENEKKLTDKETADILDKFIGFQKSETELMEVYTKKFSVFMPEDKVIKIYITEIQFKRWLLSQTIPPRPNRK